ncbi:MAG: hypothetical protein JO307_23610 [Bryobacterales bacterium]|nr:hypothetical protein [Bryobacterales bacterium]MBV9397457.1 hypothetical protein [Bryobacterales bacterium]
MRRKLMAIFLAAAGNGAAARLSPSAGRVFNSYVLEVEARLGRQHADVGSYVAAFDDNPALRGRSETRAASGEIFTERVNEGTRQLDGALLHHWRADTLAPNVTAKEMLAVLDGFHQWSGQYAQDVVSSRVLARAGDTTTLVVRFKKQVVITIVLDAEYKIESRLTRADRGYSFSRGMHFWQVDHAGTAHERRRPEGQDDGYLWRLNSYWSFAQLNDGLAIECEAVSLTRDVPAGFGWLIMPIVSDLPRELLTSTMASVKNALVARTSGEASR